MDKGGELRQRIGDKLTARVTGGDEFLCTIDVAGAHTLAVNAAHESSPINQIDESNYDRIPHEGSEKVVIKDIVSIIDRAFAEEKLFSELGVSWAKPGKTFAVAGYAEFAGGA